MKKLGIKAGAIDGLPIGMGYFSVSIAFGILAVTSGLSPITAVIISMTNVTSAGQFAGLELISSGGSYMEMILTMLIINSRYSLMSLALSQKVAGRISKWQKALIAFGITDEVFAVSSVKKQPLTSTYFLGLILVAYIGWALGTLVGAVATSLLSSAMQDALGIALYAMFIAIIIPPAKHARPILITIILAVAMSTMIEYVPIFSKISSGFAVIIVTLIAAGIAAYYFPIKEEETCI